MGDWAQGEFSVAEVKLQDKTIAVSRLRRKPTFSTGGDAFLFPCPESDEAQIAAQSELAALLEASETQVAFNLKKRSLPVRGDIDMSSAND